MRLITCSCLPVYYRRLPRSAWMKLLPARRLYRCLACNAVLFIRPVAEAEVFADTVAENPVQASAGEDSKDSKTKPA